MFCCSLDRLSTSYRPTADRLSNDNRSIWRSTVSLVLCFLFLRMSETNQKPCMTVVSLERSRWRDTVEISKWCNVLGEQRIMDFFQHVWKKPEKYSKAFVSCCRCSSVEANKPRIKLSFRLSVQFGVRTRGNVLRFVWSLNNTTYSN